MSDSPRSPLALAALATVAIPGLDVVVARPPRHPSPDYDSASLTDSHGRRWTVRSPRTTVAGAALEAEVELLASLGEAVDGGLLPFDVPRPAGFTALPEGGRAMVHRELPGRVLDVESISARLAENLGQVVAAIHGLDTSMVGDAGLPIYDAEAYRRRRLAELDEAAATGHVPAALLRRWEQALEDVRLWRFTPTVVHGDLADEQLLVNSDEVLAILDWAAARVADPADDLAWLLAAAHPETGDTILDAYTRARAGHADDFLTSRTVLASELALPRWLMHGVRTRQNGVIDDAVAMLADLDQAVVDAEPIAQISPSSTEWVTGPVPLTGTYGAGFDDGRGADDVDDGAGEDVAGGPIDGRAVHGAGGASGAIDGAAIDSAAIDSAATDSAAGADWGAAGGGVGKGETDHGPDPAHDPVRQSDPERAELPDQSETTEIPGPGLLEPDYGHQDPERGDDSPTTQLPSA